MWKLRLKIFKLWPMGGIQEWSFSLAGAVSSTPADDMAPTPLNLYSLTTDTLEDLGGFNIC